MLQRAGSNHEMVDQEVGLTLNKSAGLAWQPEPQDLRWRRTPEIAHSLKRGSLPDEDTVA